MGCDVGVVKASVYGSVNVVRIENDNIAILPVRQGFDAEGEHHDESQKKQITAFS